MATQIISFHYTLTDALGKELDSSSGAQPLSFIEGSGQIIPGLEKELKTLNVGDKRKIVVPSTEAYGTRVESLVVKVSKDKLPSPTINIGDRFSGGPEEHAPVFSVVAISGDQVTLDGNHPLAGRDLTFQIELLDRREARADEIEHGHAHGEHGHAH